MSMARFIGSMLAVPLVRTAWFSAPGRENTDQQQKHHPRRRRGRCRRGGRCRQATRERRRTGRSPRTLPERQRPSPPIHPSDRTNAARLGEPTWRARVSALGRFRGRRNPFFRWDFALSRSTQVIGTNFAIPKVPEDWHEEAEWRSVAAYLSLFGWFLKLLRFLSVRMRERERGARHAAAFTNVSGAGAGDWFEAVKRLRGAVPCPTCLFRPLERDGSNFRSCVSSCARKEATRAHTRHHSYICSRVSLACGTVYERRRSRVRRSLRDRLSSSPLHRTADALRCGHCYATTPKDRALPEWRRREGGRFSHTHSKMSEARCIFVPKRFIRELPRRALLSATPERRKPATDTEQPRRDAQDDDMFALQEGPVLLLSFQQQNFFLETRWARGRRHCTTGSGPKQAQTTRAVRGFPEHHRTPRFFFIRPIYCSKKTDRYCCWE